MKNKNFLLFKNYKKWGQIYLFALIFHLAAGLNKSIYLTDIKPGFVDTDMAKAANKFWVGVAIPQEAVLQIYDVIEHAYVIKK